MADWLNYHHLQYFWTVAREGSLGAAGKVLRLAPPTLSGQIRALEDSLGERLFARVGRKLELTATGRVVFGYAEAIFSTGQELVEVVKRGLPARVPALQVGVVELLPKLMVRRLLQPALELKPVLRPVCFEDTYDRLLARLSTHELDLVLSDAPLPAGSRVRAFEHLLGESSVTFFGAESFRELATNFPRSLNGVPVLLPIVGAPMRRALDQWFAERDLQPVVRGEFEDSALLKVFGADGLGVFAAPTAIEAEVVAQYRVDVLGRVKQLTERYYAITAERRLTHPAAMAIAQRARTGLVTTG